MSNPLTLEGKRALVTGASSGLGPTICRRLDAAGASVVIHYHHNEAGARNLSEQLARRNEPCRADLSDLDDISHLFEAAASVAPLDILVNCAATESQYISNLTDIDIERWARTQRTNVDAPLMLIQRFADQGRPGAIVNISSIEGSRPAPGHGHYSTSKAALEMLTQSAALELGSQGIRVNAVAPGLIHREGIEEAWPEGVNAWQESAPLSRLVAPDDIANAVLFLSADESAAITGTVLTVDCGLSVKPGW